MANAGAQPGPQEYPDDDEPMAYDDAAAAASQGTATQGAKRGRDGAEPGPGDDAKRRRQANHTDHSQGPNPAAARAAEECLREEKLARRAEDMLVQLKQAATSNAASWKGNAPSAQQKEKFDRQVERTVQCAKQAFPAAAACLPVDQVSARERHAVTLVEQARVAVSQAHEAYDRWLSEAEDGLTQLAAAAKRAESAWRRTAPTQAQVAELQRRADTTWDLVRKVFPAAAAGLPAAQIPEHEAEAVGHIAKAKAALQRALRVAKFRSKQEGSVNVEMQDAAVARPDPAVAAAMAAEARGWSAPADPANQRALKRRAVAAAQPPLSAAAAAAPEPAAGSSRPALAGQAAAATAAGSKPKPADVMARLLSAASALLPDPAANQQADYVHEIDQSGPAPTAAQLATWANAALQVLIEQADAATFSRQTGTKPTEQQLRRLRGKARSAVSQWQQAIAAVGGDLGYPTSGTLVQLAEQATRALIQLQDAARMVQNSAPKKRKSVAHKDARAAAAEQACRAVWRRALAAISVWQHNVPTLQEALDLKQEAESAKQLALGVWGFPTTQCPVVAWLRDALKQSMDTAAVSALTKVQKQASVVTLKCRCRPPGTEEWQALEAAYATAQGLVAASPDPSVHKALSDTAHAAFAEARAAKEKAETEQRRAMVLAAVKAARDHAREAAYAWEDRPPSDDEADDLRASITHAEALLEAHPGLCPERTLTNFIEACERAWNAAHAAVAAQAARREAARQETQQALTIFTQQALLLHADWARKGRKSPPERDGFVALQKRGREARELAKQACPEAYAYVQQRLREPGTEPDDVPEEEAHAVTLIEEARGAMQAVMDVWKAWEYVSTVATAAAAA